MRKEAIDTLVKARILRIKQLDKERAESMLKSSETNAGVAKMIALNEDSATLIFREIYESIRQLGDVKWWLLNCEPSNHEISIDILKEMGIKEKIKLNFLDRFKKIRHDANYRGFRVTIAQAKEIIEFWDNCGREIIKLIRKELVQGVK